MITQVCLCVCKVHSLYMMLCLALDAESTSNVRVKSFNHYLLCVSQLFVCCLDGFDAA